MRLERNLLPLPRSPQSPDLVTQPTSLAGWPPTSPSLAPPLPGLAAQFAGDGVVPASDDLEGRARARELPLERPGDAFVLGRNEFGQPIDVDAVVANDVRQGDIGDCFLLAAMATLAAQDPGAVRRLIANPRHDAEGRLLSCTVRLFLPALPPAREGTRVARDIVVDCTQFPVRRANFGDEDDGHEELWPLIIEKAYALGVSDGYPGLDLGGTAGAAMTALTGARAARLPVAAYDFERLTRDLAAHGLVSFATPDAEDARTRNALARAGLVRDHAYAVLGTKIDERGERWVQLYNPWGYDHPGDPAMRAAPGGFMKYDEAQRLFGVAFVAVSNPRVTEAAARGIRAGYSLSSS